MRALVLALVLALTAAGCLGQKPQDEPITTTPEDEVAPAAAAGDGDTPPSPAPAAAQTAPPASSNATHVHNTSAPAPPAPPPVAAPRIEVLAWTGSLTGAGIARDAPQARAAAENDAGSFEVGSGLDGIVLELVWSEEHFDLDLALDAPDVADVTPPGVSGTSPQLRSGHRWETTAGAPGTPDRHARIAVTDAEALALVGVWNWSVYAKGPASEVAFTVYVSLFHDAAPADGYSAAPSGGSS